MVENLRNDYKITEANRPIIIEFVINVIVRNRYLRITTTDAVGDLFGMAGKNLSAPSKTYRLLAKGISQEKYGFKEKLYKEIRKKIPNVSNHQLEMAYPILESMAENWIFKMSGKFSENITNEIERFLGNIDSLGAKFHKEGLESYIESGDTSKRHIDYSELFWLIKKFEPNTFNLGDIGAVAIDLETNNFFPPFKRKHGDYAVILPISHDFLLCGSTKKSPDLPPSSIINLSAIEMSTDFFVSSTLTEVELSHSKKIGKNASWWAEEIAAIERNTFGDVD